MDEHDQDDIIRKVKTSGAADDTSDAEKEVSSEPEVEPEVDSEPTNDTEDMFGGEEGGLEEDDTFSQFDLENNEEPNTLKRLGELQESKKNDIFVENTDMKNTIKGKLDEMAEPAIKPPVVKPGEKPSRRTKRIWEPKPLVKPRPKMGI
jgi:hypothetical protein